MSVEVHDLNHSRVTALDRAFHVLEMALDVVDQQYLDGYPAIVSRR